jgi:hypothetical protein
MKTISRDAFFPARVEKVALFPTLPYKPPPEPPGEACRGGSYAFEKPAETAKSIPSQESADIYLSALRTARSVGATAPRR